MKAPLFIALAAVASSPASAADKATCDAKPFTLGKPPAPPPAKPKVVAHAAPEKVAPKPAEKPRLLATCKDGKGAKKKAA